MLLTLTALMHLPMMLYLFSSTLLYTLDKHACSIEAYLKDVVECCMTEARAHGRQPVVGILALLGTALRCLHAQSNYISSRFINTIYFWNCVVTSVVFRIEIEDTGKYSVVWLCRNLCIFSESLIEIRRDLLKMFAALFHFTDFTATNTCICIN